MSKILKIIFIAAFIGLVSGALSSSFLHLLTRVTEIRHASPQFIWGLPLFGLIFSFVIKKVPHHINQGVPYILEELDNHKAHVSPWMAPFIFLSSIGTHLFGGSAGREGVGVIMGASAAHMLPRLSSHFQNVRKFLIFGGIAAGFSSIFGTPLAAIVFAFELHSFKHFKEIDLLTCTTLASFAALVVPYFFGPLHQHFEVSLNLNEVIPYILIVGIVSGIGANLFYWGFKGYTRFVSFLFPHLSTKLAVGGLMVSALVFFTNSYQYVGIGIDVIAESFFREMSYYDFTMKALLTIMTITIGFKGGEVTPLFFMGATFSNWACSFFNLRNYAFSSSLGMIAMFGAVTGTPFASAIMGAELFGWEVGVCCLFCCLIARFSMGNRTLYRH
jgi:H+/Cl- antiporter ClcA